MDVVADDIELPPLEIGDVVIMTNAGAYGEVLSPMQFASQDKPEEMFLLVDGSILKSWLWEQNVFILIYFDKY